MFACLRRVLLVSTLLGLCSHISAAPSIKCHCAGATDLSLCACARNLNAEHARFKRGTAESDYWSDSPLSDSEEGVKRSSEANDGVDTGLSSVFRWGKREDSSALNSVFRWGKRGGGDGNSKRADSDNAAYGNVFRWGKRAPFESLDYKDDAVDANDLKRLFRWGKRSAQNSESASPQIFRWGKRGDSAPAMVFRWGKRSKEIGNPPVFRWGKREYGDDLNMRLHTILSQWPGKRVVNAPDADDGYASVFRWGKRGQMNDEALDGPSIFRWGKRDDTAAHRKLHDNVAVDEDS